MMMLVANERVTTFPALHTGAAEGCLRIVTLAQTQVVTREEISVEFGAFDGWLTVEKRSS